MVDLIAFLEEITLVQAGISILLIMILQSPILTFPGYILMIYSGYKFGFLPGTLINFTGLYLSCILGYRFGRWGSIDSSSPKMQKFNDWIQKRGMNAVLFLRILPLIPNNVTSIGSGFAKLPEKTHALYSLFCIIQSAFWCFLGSRLLNSLISDLELDVTLFHLFLGLTVILGLVYLKKKYGSD
ncbi:MAG: VTT domain-containing protein [Candidatus Heimdallarchaeota archaeon]|nr:VTT domain-containing protein [Candidatus Heimdallarchaeota archaeon]